MRNDNGEFEIVKDLGALAILAMRGHKPVEVIKEQHGNERPKVLFKFKRTLELKQLLEEYFLYRMQVEPRAFSHTMRAVRESIFQHQKEK